VEIVAVRASLRSPLAAEASAQESRGESTPTSSQSLSAYSFVLGEWVRFEVLQRASLAAGEELSGPAIVVEGTTTVYVDAGYGVSLDESGALVIERSPADLRAESMATVGARD
jgi:N-methylhydantoinase A